MISNDEKMLKERLRFIFSVKKIKIADLTETKSEAVMLSRQLGENDATVPFRTLHKVLYAYPDVDANWLILGEGTWQKTTDHPQIFNQQHYEMQNGDNNSGTINFGETIPYPVKALLDEKDKRIAELEKVNQTLQNVVNAFTAGLKK